MGANPASLATRRRSGASISVVLPVYNEAVNIEALYSALADAFDGQGSEIEFLFINDGSVDASADLIRDLRTQDKRVKLVEFSRNFGHQAALTAGIDLSRGDAVILMDADMQDPPEILSEMIEAWRAGADVVYAVRQKRKEPAILRGAFYAYYRLLRRLANIEIPVDSGDFCLMDRKVVNELKRMPERNRFLRGLRSWVGFNQVSLPYERPVRHAGGSKYNLKKRVLFGLSGILAFSSLPLRLATFLGFGVCVAATVFFVWVIFNAIFYGYPVQGWASLAVLILFMAGVQLLILGAIGEYVALIHDEVKQRPNYVVREFLD